VKPSSSTWAEEAGHPTVALRWECRCRNPAVLLGTVDRTGRVNIKVRDRYFHIEGRVWTQCPRCGAEHTLDPAALPSGS
jgi:hypothetical protein